MCGIQLWVLNVNRVLGMQISMKRGNRPLAMSLRNLIDKKSKLLPTLSTRIFYCRFTHNLTCVSSWQAILDTFNNPSNPEISPMALISQHLSKKALDFQFPMLRTQNTATWFVDMLKNGTKSLETAIPFSYSSNSQQLRYNHSALEECSQLTSHWLWSQYIHWTTYKWALIFWLPMLSMNYKTNTSLSQNLRARYVSRNQSSQWQRSLYYY